MGRKFWDLHVRRNMTWGWRKILHVRPVIHLYFFGHTLGDGKTTSTWFDRWCSLSPLMNLISTRDISRSGFLLSSKVADLVRDGIWQWPNDWATRFPNIYMLDNPALDPSARDTQLWKDITGALKQFSVGLV